MKLTRYRSYLILTTVATVAKPSRYYIFPMPTGETEVQTMNWLHIAHSLQEAQLVIDSWMEAV